MQILNAKKLQNQNVIDTHGEQVTDDKKKPEFDVKITDKKYVRYKEAAARYSMGLHTFQELAKEANAIYHIRKIVLVNTQIFEDYLENFKE